MGRGRAKAKQTKVARELKYSSPTTDLEALQRELSGGNGANHGVDDRGAANHDAANHGADDGGAADRGVDDGGADDHGVDDRTEDSNDDEYDQNRR